MTHAALQDLVKKWRVVLLHIAQEKSAGEGEYWSGMPDDRLASQLQKRINGYSAMAQDALDAEPDADELSAALSAMEGEAVGHVTAYRAVHFYNDPPGPAVGTKLYTAPPPQQAEEVSDATIEAAWEAGVPVEGDTGYTAFRRAVIAAIKHMAATHPTPSPGPQGATPPQPEAQVSDAMARKADEAYRAFTGAFDTPAAWRRDCSDYADDARERLRQFFADFAALTTSGRDGE